MVGVSSGGYLDSLSGRYLLEGKQRKELDNSLWHLYPYFLVLVNIRIHSNNLVCSFHSSV
jgi:hypothetical protein